MRRNAQLYFHYFEKAGYRFMNSGFISEEKIEEILVAVEEKNRIRFPRDIRVQIWKALRHQWFQGPGHDVPYVMREHMPKLCLPKRHFVQVDANLIYNSLEPDRQRQVRRVIKRKLEGGAISLETLQFEVYKREFDMWYEYKDLRRCVDEWQQKNPRTMLKEDPREELLKNCARKIMESAGAQLIMRRRAKKSLVRLEWVLFILQMLCLIMSILMFFIAFSRYTASPGGLKWNYTWACVQFRAGVAYFVAFFFVNTVLNRRHGDPKIKLLLSILTSLDRVLEEISDFRVESEALRLVDQVARRKEMEFAQAEAQKAAKKEEAVAQSELFERKQRKQRASKEAETEDADLKRWLGDDAKNMGKGKLDVKAITNSINESFKSLPELPPNFRRPGGAPGGNRMLIDRNHITTQIPASQMANLRVRIGKKAIHEEETLSGLENRETFPALVGRTASSEAGEVCIPAGSRSTSRDVPAILVSSTESRTGTRLNSRDPGNTRPGSRDPDAGRVGTYRSCSQMKDKRQDSRTVRVSDPTDILEATRPTDQAALGSRGGSASSPSTRMGSRHSDSGPSVSADAPRGAIADAISPGGPRAAADAAAVPATTTPPRVAPQDAADSDGEPLLGAPH